MQRTGRDVASGATAVDSDDKKEDKNRRGAAPWAVPHQVPWGQGRSKAKTSGLLLVAFCVLQAGLWLAWGHFLPGGAGVKTHKCGVIVLEYAIRSLADAQQLPPDRPLKMAAAPNRKKSCVLQTPAIHFVQPCQLNGAASKF